MQAGLWSRALAVFSTGPATCCSAQWPTHLAALALPLVNLLRRQFVTVSQQVQATLGYPAAMASCLHVVPAVSVLPCDALAAVGV
jgi:hypothetical protein